MLVVKEKMIIKVGSKQEKKNIASDRRFVVAVVFGLLTLWFLVYFHFRASAFLLGGLPEANFITNILLEFGYTIFDWFGLLKYALLMDPLLLIVNYLVLRWGYRIHKLSVISIPISLIVTILTTYPYLGGDSGSIYFYTALLCSPSLFLQLYLILVFYPIPIAAP